MTKFPSKYKNDSSLSSGFSFIKAYNLWHKKVKERLKVIELTHPQFVVLATIGYLCQHQREVKQIDISKNSNIDVMTLSTIISRLEKSELIERKKSRRDPRAKVVTLTNEGSNKLQKAVPLVEQVDNEFFGKLDIQNETFNLLLLELINKNSENLS
ncbi:MarR family transcriptional regulator [Lactococcus lactis]|uniref:MarR family transcriptional regulator n=2 Tax=Lactococcus lactis TaxID=1358 RepID=A0AAE4NMM9_9LACT|nr:MarR family transcriptional regulator [Lactococcus lactis]MCM6845208.1 MarR family transcriptional regulator [Lactococcus lactis]MDT2863645.1 MarR family transcriptional regulator [Lactococcus lactis]MDT2871740.1 MarR family transcriptional regulator [Lactococcus lactis]MDT2882681.1 MarR family transcriptional regulator [Lactococcus lactis]MDT2893415.1 MarR family transcriptional regulator [Lactococcus lactis]